MMYEFVDLSTCSWSISIHLDYCRFSFWRYYKNEELSSSSINAIDFVDSLFFSFFSLRL